MPKPILKHQTHDGVVHTRQTARTYTHVIIQKGSIVWNPDRQVYAHVDDGKVFVTAWVGRPDLVAAAIRAAGKYRQGGDLTRHYEAEPINGGNRPGCAGDVEGAYTPTQSGELA